MTIHESCIDKDGKFVDKPMTVRMVQWQPYCVKKPFDSKTPVCAQCKRTNRTKGFCRERHKHRQLPWCSVYVLLSTMEAADPSTVVAGASRKVEESDTASNGGDAKEDSSEVVAEATVSDSGGSGDDINDIAESRTFLAMVNCRSSSIHWLDLSEHETGIPETSGFAAVPMDSNPYGQHPPMGMHPVDPSHGYPQFHPGMNYAAQQHQLQSRQQYFFHLQQQQQFPPGVPPPWPQPYHMPLPAPGDASPGGATAGEAAAAQQRQGADASTPPQHPQPMMGAPPHWAAYYPGLPYPPPPADQNGQPPMAALPELDAEGAPAPVVKEENGNDSNNNEEEQDEEEEEPGTKRQRMV